MTSIIYRKIYIKCAGGSGEAHQGYKHRKRSSLVTGRIIALHIHAFPIRIPDRAFPGALGPGLFSAHAENPQFAIRACRDTSGVSCSGPGPGWRDFILTVKRPEKSGFFD